MPTAKVSFMSRFLTRVSSTASLVLMTIILAFTSSPTFSLVHAINPDSTVIQGPIDTGVSFGTSGSLTFASPVTKGDVVVVAVVTQFNAQPQSINDSLHSHYKLEASQCFPNLEGDCSYIYSARPHATGSDTVSLTKSTANGFVFFLYEVSGTEVHSAVASTGSGLSNSVSTSPVSFSSEGFLVAVVESFGGGGLTAGSGFTATSDISFIWTEFSTSGVAAPTSFPGTLTNSAQWTEVGVAFTP